MAKFRVGDEVRHHRCDDNCEWFGRVGVVVCVDEFFVTVDFDDDSVYAVVLAEDEIELVDEYTSPNEGSDPTVKSRKFSKGDKVRVARILPSSTDEKRDFFRDEAVVVYVYDTGYWPYVLDISDEFRWGDDELEIVASSTLVTNVAVTPDRMSPDGVVVVDGKKVDVEALFYRMLAKKPKRARRKRKAS